MKKYLTLFLLLLLLGLTYLFRSPLYQLYQTIFNKNEQTIRLNNTNNYAKTTSFDYVQLTNSFQPQKKQDLLNIYYTVLNAGKKEFSFYCPDRYENCIEDIKDIANDQTILSTINNFVHPFNSFKNLETTYDEYGKISLHINPIYSANDIELLSAKIKSIEQEIWNDNMSQQEKIKEAHNYIINHSKYDSQRSDQAIVEYKSDTAYGTLLQGYSLCGGYTDAMALFLEDLHLKNYKIASENHVWNGLYLDGNWYHLDLTWDDPITKDGTDLLEYDFFLITTTELKKLEVEQHNYNEVIYREMQNISN